MTEYKECKEYFLPIPRNNEILSLLFGEGSIIQIYSGPLPENLDEADNQWPVALIRFTDA